MTIKIAMTVISMCWAIRCIISSIRDMDKYGEFELLSISMDILLIVVMIINIWFEGVYNA